MFFIIAFCNFLKILYCQVRFFHQFFIFFIAHINKLSTYFILFFIFIVGASLCLALLIFYLSALNDFLLIVCLTQILNRYILVQFVKSLRRENIFWQGSIEYFIVRCFKYLINCKVILIIFKFWKNSTSLCFINIKDRMRLFNNFKFGVARLIIQRYLFFINIFKNNSRNITTLSFCPFIMRHFLFSSGLLIYIQLKMLRSASKILKFRNSHIKTVGNIDFHQYDSFVKVVLNRPKALNSLNLQMIRDLRSQLDKINQNKAFWIEGAGGKAFCAGGDVKALFEKDSTPADRITFFREEFELDYKISQLKALQIANWDGIVMGGGFGVSAFAPFIIATENTMFAMPEAKLGFFTDVGSSYLLSRLRNNIGYYLGMTGARLKGQSVYLSGLAHYYIPSNQIAAVYSQIQQSIAQAQNTKQTIKSILQKHHKNPQNSSIEHESEIKQLFGLSSVKQIYRTALSKKDKFHETVVKQLNQQCPISISIIQKLINSAKTKTIKQAFIQDFYLSQHMSTEPNFAEGVRCVLIDKGSVPKWSHQTIEDLNEDDANRYLLPLSSFEKLNI